MVSFSAAALLVTGCATDDSPEGQNNNLPDTGVDAGNDVGEEVLDLRSVEPSQGNLAGGTMVSLSGRGFVSGMTVQFGDAQATQVLVRTSRQATAVTPAATAPGAVDVIVTNPDQTQSKMPGAYTYVEAADPQVGFCQLQPQSPVSYTLGDDAPNLYAVLFAEGVTQGAGQGQGLEAELGWGSGDPANFEYVPMVYNVDKDGLTPGDLANDEYGAPLAIPSTGEFQYMARARGVGRRGWIYCDLDGSDNGAEAPGIINVTEPAAPTIEFCQLQAQSPASATTGEDSERLHAFVYANGVTPGDGQGTGIVGELGFGTGDPTGFDFVPMNYNGDIDGPNAGDKANDEYGARLRSNVAGDYAYVARFKAADGPWVYCDLDGSANGVDAPGEFSVSDPPVPTVGFCQTNTAALTALSGQASAAIEGTVFSAGITAGSGMGAGVQAELVYGPWSQSPTSWTNKVVATYEADRDGLNAGDLANDVYTAVIPSQVQGDYGFAYRFSLDAGATWTYCDTSGSPPFEDTAVGELEVRDVVVNLADSCKLQFPAIMTSALIGEDLTVFGRVTEAGKTGTGILHPDLRAEVLVGAENLDPVADLASFQKFPASLSTAGVINPAPGEDEFAAVFNLGTAGAFVMAYRFSVDGGQNWRTCDLDPTTPFDRKQAGHISVFDAASAPDLVDYCNVWQTGWTVSTADSAPTVTIETYEGGVTDSGSFAGTELEAEVGFGVGNPAINGAFSWKAMDYKGPRPAAPNNQEYETTLYGAAPASGSYDVAARVRRAGSGAWVYCDTNNSTMNYLPAAAAKLVVNP